VVVDSKLESSSLQRPTEEIVERDGWPPTCMWIGSFEDPKKVFHISLTTH